MPEELRFFLRIAVFTTLIGTIYWFVAYERAGATLFAFVVAGARAFVLIFRRRARGAGDADRRPGPLGALGRVLGFDERGVPDTPVEVEDELIAAASIWPAAAGAAALLIALGLVYGAWFWVPGLAVALATAWGWITELDA